MQNIKRINIKKIAFLSSVFAFSAAIQIITQSFYPTFNYYPNQSDNQVSVKFSNFK